MKKATKQNKNRGINKKQKELAPQSAFACRHTSSSVGKKDVYYRIETIFTLSGYLRHEKN